LVGLNIEDAVEARRRGQGRRGWTGEMKIESARQERMRWRPLARGIREVAGP
jgi:hypothetical protein